MMLTKRMSSAHWKNFERLDFSKVRCRHCNRVISISRGSTGNMSRHMRLKHRDVFMATMDHTTIKEDIPESASMDGEIEEPRVDNRNHSPDPKYHWKRLSLASETRLGRAQLVEGSEEGMMNVMKGGRMKEAKTDAEESNTDGNSSVEIPEDDNDVKTTDEEPQDSEDYSNTIIINHTDFKQSNQTGPGTQSKPTYIRRRKLQRSSGDIMRKMIPLTHRGEDDEFTIMGRNIANKLRRLPQDKVPVVEKLITDIIFEAQCGSVNQSTRISFFDVRSSTLRNLNGTTPILRQVPQKSEGQTAMPPNVVFLMPQEGQKGAPIKVQNTAAPNAPEVKDTKPPTPVK